MFTLSPPLTLQTLVFLFCLALLGAGGGHGLAKLTRAPDNTTASMVAFAHAMVGVTIYFLLLFLLPAESKIPHVVGLLLIALNGFLFYAGRSKERKQEEQKAALEKNLPQLREPAIAYEKALKKYPPELIPEGKFRERVSRLETFGSLEKSFQSLEYKDEKKRLHDFLNPAFRELTGRALHETSTADLYRKTEEMERELNEAVKNNLANRPSRVLIFGDSLEPSNSTHIFMSELNRAFRFFGRVVSTAIRNPRRTAESLNQLSSMVQGAQFGSEATIWTKLQAEADSFEPANPLFSYFNKHREGAGIWKWTHYFDIYQRHFSKFVDREVHVLEVGIYSGGSLSMWKEYFGTKCHVYGVDIEEACTAYKEDNIEIFIGDQADRSFWARIRQAVPIIDILIDDGGHHPEQQRITLEEMLPHLSPGGVYLCEDIHGTTNRFAAYLQGLASSLHSAVPAEMPNGIPGLAYTPSNFQQAIQAIHLYPFVAVIEKRERNLRQFIAPKQGTQWQPFL